MLKISIHIVILVVLVLLFAFLWITIDPNWVGGLFAVTAALIGYQVRLVDHLRNDTKREKRLKEKLEKEGVEKIEIKVS